MLFQKAVQRYNKQNIQQICQKNVKTLDICHADVKVSLPSTASLINPNVTYSNDFFIFQV